MSILHKIQSLIQLLKASLALSILFTVIPGLLLGPALPSFTLICFTLLGTWLTACSAFVYNQIMERDRDALMTRTCKRPLVEGRLSLASAHVLGSALLGLGLYMLAVGSQPLAALIALVSFVYYVFVYTLLLKPRTHWNTVAGGVAGSLGPLIGEAAVSGRVSEYGLFMFLLLFLWQPPHFWCLAIYYKDDYQRAKLPVLPVTHGVAASLNQMLLYQILLCLLIALVFLPPLEMAGPVFFWPSLTYGLVVLGAMWSLKKKWLHSQKTGSKTAFSPMRVFAWTITHMIVWHLSLSLDLYLRLWAKSY